MEGSRYIRPDEKLVVDANVDAHLGQALNVVQEMEDRLKFLRHRRDEYNQVIGEVEGRLSSLLGPPPASMPVMPRGF